MAENIMQIACDAFALGDRSERNVLFERGAKLAFGAFLLGEVDVATANHDHEEYGDERVRPADIKRAIMCGDGEERSLREDGYTLKENEGDDLPRRLDDEGKKRCGVDEECGSAAVPREHRESQNESGADHPEACGQGWACSVEESPEDAKEDDEAGNGAEPEVAVRLKQRLDQEEAGVGEPHPCPSVLAALRVGFVGGHCFLFS